MGYELVLKFIEMKKKWAIVTKTLSTQLAGRVQNKTILTIAQNLCPNTWIRQIRFLTRSVPYVSPMIHIKLSIQAACTISGTRWHIYLMRWKHIISFYNKFKTEEYISIKRRYMM